MSKLSPFVFHETPNGITAVRKERDDMKHEVEIMDEYDRLHPNGKYVMPSGEPPRIRFRDMNNYCNKVGKKPMELTEEEMEQFRY